MLWSVWAREEGGARAVLEQLRVWRSCRASWLRTRDALVPLTAFVELTKAALLSRAVSGKLAPQRETKAGGLSRRIFQVREEAAVCGRRS